MIQEVARGFPRHERQFYSSSLIRNRPSRGHSFGRAARGTAPRSVANQGELSAEDHITPLSTKETSVTQRYLRRRPRRSLLGLRTPIAPAAQDRLLAHRPAPSPLGQHGHLPRQPPEPTVRGLHEASVPGRRAADLRPGRHDDADEWQYPSYSDGQRERGDALQAGALPGHASPGSALVP
jgi:hypothetical protein